MNKEIKQNRYESIDILKALMAFLVICIHAPIDGKIGTFIVDFSRIAVPVFFMISGYFYKSKYLKKQCLKIIKYIIFSIILYVIYCNCIGGTINITLRNLFVLLFFNDPIALPIGRHIWYLFSIFYVLILYELFLKKIKCKFLFSLSFVLLLLGLLIGTYGPILKMVSLPIFVSRNFLFTGIPFFIFGKILNEASIKSKPEYCFVLGSVIFCFEEFIFYFLGIQRFGDLTIGTIILALLIFIAFINIKSFSCAFLSKIGHDYAVYIYIFHPIVINCFKTYCSHTSPYLVPVLVYLGSVFLAILYKYVLNMVTNVIHSILKC